MVIPEDKQRLFFDQTKTATPMELTAQTGTGTAGAREWVAWQLTPALLAVGTVRGHAVDGTDVVRQSRARLV